MARATVPAVAGTLIAGCISTHLMMWALTNALRLTLIILMAMRLKRE